VSNILITDGIDEAGLALLQEAAQVDDRPGISAEELLAAIPTYEALIVRGRTKVPAALIAAALNLKVVGRAGVGVDNIDLAAAQARGITVVNTPTATSVAVAELTLGLLLATAREFPRADAAMKAGKWPKKELEGVELSGKSLGVIGYGRIGAEVGRLGSAFGMHALGYDPLLPPQEIMRRGGEPVDLDTLYGRSDFITLHVPLDEGTRGMIDEAAIAKMKAGVRIVCAARGGVIDEAALLAALEQGKVAAAGLDVFAVEPPGPTALVAHPRVVATPHIGAQTLEAQSRASLDIASEVLAALRGQPLRWKVA
jgi:D-3-phosphoglycerate dehydrogenase / 2-oxoglutarate reductase